MMPYFWASPDLENYKHDPGLKVGAKWKPETLNPKPKIRKPLIFQETRQLKP